MTKRGMWTLIGFLCFLFGILSLTVNLVGLNFGFLRWIEAFGRVGAFVFKLAMTVGGIVIVALANASNEEDYDEFFDGGKAKN